VLLDDHGRAIRRVKQFGFLRSGPAYELVEPAAIGEFHVADAIGELHDFEDEDEAEDRVETASFYDREKPRLLVITDF